MIESPDNVARIFELDQDLNKHLHLLNVHAMVAHFQDFADSHATGMYSRICDKYAEIAAKTAWIRPELLSLSCDTLQQYRQSAVLQPYLRVFDQIVRYKPHTLSEPEETLLSAASSALSASRNTYGHLTNADLVFTKIENEKGEKVELTKGNYLNMLKSQSRTVRKAAFSSRYDAYIAHKSSICSMIDGSVKSELFYQKAQRFPSCLEHSLFADNIPVSVYHSLISTVHAHLPTFYRYLSCRQRVLGLPTLDMYDLYVPLVKDVDLTITYETACDWVLAALAPFGPEYVATAKDGLLGEGRWVDVFETKGKRSGACSIQNAGGKQYMMLNFTGTMSNAFTLAHELGHSMHHHYSTQSQPHRYAFPSLAVCEVASTVNEALLFHYLLNKAVAEGNTQMEKYLLNIRCEDFKGTLIRQTQFAEFELRLHEMAEQGKALTPDSISALYKEINDVYYGDVSAHTDPSTPPPKYPHVLKADPRIAYEFMAVPHFFTPFYVYKYSTSFSVAEALVPGIVAGDKDVLDKYFTLLRVCSSYSVLSFSILLFLLFFHG